MIRMVEIVCDDCDATFGTAGDYAAHRESEHTRPPRQPFGHR